MDERLIYQILSVVEEIPEGRVATYGQIARLLRAVSVPSRCESRGQVGPRLA